MKNFRKVLALILVVATLFSFVAMASAKSATEYTDYADVKYVEAVDVLTALGIINGYDGAFHPADTIDRDEMAKMIAVLRNAGDFDADLYAPANKFADAEGSWAEGYIAYCAQLGIINGLNATTFAPDAAVKVVEVAKMLLCTLGFDGAKQGYVGANWEVAVIRDATKYGIIPADVNPYEAATRDQAAQMFLNALQAYMVAGYVSENIVYVTNSLYANKTATNNDNVVLDNISLKEAEKSGWEIAYGNAVVSKTPLMSIYKYLTLSEDATYDCFGRPGHTWTLTAANGKVLFQKHYSNAPLMTFTNASTAAVKAAIMELKGVKTWEAAKMEVYEDGFSSSLDCGNGTLVEVYAGRVVVINSYVGKVSKVNEYYNYFELVDANKQPLAKFALNGAELKAGDVVLFHLCNGKTPHVKANTGLGNDEHALHDIQVIKPTTADVSYGRNTADFNTSYFIADGQSYYYDWNLGYMMKDLGRFIFDDVAVQTKYDLYFDEYGFVIYYEKTDLTPDYLYAYVEEGSVYRTGLVQTPNTDAIANDDAWTEMAKLAVYGTDGAIVAAETEVDAALYAGMNDRYVYDEEATTGDDVGMLIKYYINAKGKFVYTGDYGYYAPEGARLGKASFIIDDAADSKSERTGVYADEYTKFMIRTENADGTYNYKQVTGYQNLDRDYVATNVNVGSYGASTRTNIQYFVNPSYPEVATYVFIDAKYTTAEASRFMIISKAEYFAFDTAIAGKYADDYVAYTALVDGKESIILLTKGLNDNVRPAIMYTDILQFIDVVMTNDGDLPLYVYAEMDLEGLRAGDPVQYKYNTENDKFVSIDVDGTFKLRKIAADATLWTIHVADENEDGVYEITLTEGIMDLEADGNPDTSENITSAYVTFNKAGEVVELIRIAPDAMLKLYPQY